MRRNKFPDWKPLRKSLRVWLPHPSCGAAACRGSRPTSGMAAASWPTWMWTCVYLPCPVWALPVCAAHVDASGTPADVFCGAQVSQMGLKLEEVKTKKPLGCVAFGGAACAAPAGRRRHPLPSADMLCLRQPAAALNARGEQGRRAQCGPGFKHGLSLTRCAPLPASSRSRISSAGQHRATGCVRDAAVLWQRSP